MPLHICIYIYHNHINLFVRFGKFIEKHEGKLTQQSKGPLQGNGMAAISKSPFYLSRCYFQIFNYGKIK